MTQGFHTWPGRMHPFTARHLVRMMPAGAIVDPFMGGGTVIVEAMLQGRRAIGTDINPVGAEVAWARTRWWSRGQRDDLLRAARDLLKHAHILRKAGRVDKATFAHDGPWYDPPALMAVWSLAQALHRSDKNMPLPLRRMLRMCLSSILVKASKQASDSVVVKDKNHKWITDKRVDQWFIARVEEHARNLGDLERALKKQATTGASPVAPMIAQEDARTPWLAFTGEAKELPEVAGIVSSPPYPGVYDYAAHHQRRYRLLGLEEERAQDEEIGARRAQRAAGEHTSNANYVDGLSQTLGAWDQRLVSGGMVAWVIGDGQGLNGAIPVLPLVDRAASRAGYARVATVSQQRPTFRVGGGQQRDKDEHIVVLMRQEEA